MSEVLPTLSSTASYRSQAGAIIWEGRSISDQASFCAFLRDVVGPALNDDEDFEREIRALATTGMATDHVEKLLRAVPEPLAWEIGEALAERVIAGDLGWNVRWPWNSRHDRRTPRASLPGADLIGFLKEQGAVHILIGEIKTSSETTSPPRVMRGKTGMVSQLELSAESLGVQRTVIEWLLHRCTSAEDRALFQAAATRYFGSSGRDLVLVGALLRDTPADERDLAKHGKALASTIDAPTRVHLVAWYLPVAIAEWPKLARRTHQ